MSGWIRDPVQYRPAQLRRLHLAPEPHPGRRGPLSAMGLHLLGEDQLDMARLFGEETGDRSTNFADVDWRIGRPERHFSPMCRWRSRERSSAISRWETTRPLSSAPSAPKVGRVAAC